MTDTPYIRPDMKAFLDLLASIGGPKINEISLEEARAGYLALHTMADAPARELAVIRDLTCPGPAGDIRLRLYDARATREPGPVIVYYHGGGFVIGDLETHHALCSEIAALMDLPLVAVDYRLAPEAPFPAAIDDCEAATRWIASNPPELGRAATSLVTIGDSAGGNATVVVGQLLAAHPAAVPVAVQVPLFPIIAEVEGLPSYRDFADGFVLTKVAIEFFDAAYGADRADPRGFPILGDHSAAPPTVLVTASLDPIRDSGRAYARVLAEAGRSFTFLEIEGVTHSFTNLRKAVPSTQGDLERIIAAMKLHLAGAWLVPELNELPYRPCAGFMLVNADARVFVGQRIDSSAKETWQMPQGGIDPGEDPRTAALRELEEETGIAAHLVEVIAAAAQPLRYDLPPDLLGKIWKGKYRGQEQHRFLGRFRGTDADINLEAHDPPEFEAFQWVEPEQLPELIVPFKRAVYEALVEQFRALI